MAHRTLVAYRRGDDSFRLHYAHRGRALGRRIALESPLGGVAAGAPASIREVLDEVDVDVRGGRAAQARDSGDEGRSDRPDPTAVDPRPIRRDADAAAVLAALDATVETLVVVSPAYRTTTYRRFPVSFPVLPEAVGDRHEKDRDDQDDRWQNHGDDENGQCENGQEFVLAAPHGDPDDLWSWFVAVRSRLATAFARGSLTGETARSVLRRALARRADVHDPDDASFLRID